MCKLMANEHSNIRTNFFFLKKKKPYLHIRLTLISFFKGVQQKRPTEAQSVILRRYFLELTESFIIPLVSCIAYTKKSNKEGFFFGDSVPQG